MEIQKPKVKIGSLFKQRDACCVNMVIIKTAIESSIAVGKEVDVSMLSCNIYRT